MLRDMLETTRSLSRVLAGATLLLALAVSAPAAPQAVAPVQDPFAIPATDDGLPGAGPIRRYDWFQKLWRERRAAVGAASVEQDRGAVVFLGDSITQGWGGGLGAAFPGVKVANRGISGDTTRGVLIRLQDDVLALDPAAVVLLIGTNDLEEGATPEVIAGNLKLILAALEKHDPQHADRALPGVPELGDEEAPGRQDQGGERALPRRGEERPAGHLARDLAALRRRRAATRRSPSSPTCCTRTRSATPSGRRRCARSSRRSGSPRRAPIRSRPRTASRASSTASDLTGWGYRPTSEADKASAARWQASDPERRRLAVRHRAGRASTA